MKLKKILIGAVALAAVATFTASQPSAYTFGSSKWGTTPVPIYINPQNSDMTADAAEAAVLWSINEWNTKSGTTFRWQYNGRTTQTSTGNDGRNMVVFRNSTSGGALATTYSWWSGSSRIDADVIIWDGAYKFYAGASGCSGSGAYVEDIATHELGHALGLGHSSVSDASMLSGYRYCSQDQRTLAADDIAGAQALYPKSSTTTTNTAPSVQISSPSLLSVTAGTSITFAGSANDSQDGNLTSKLAWTSSIDGALGYGGAFAKSLTAGIHIITAKVTDAGGLAGTKQVSLTVSLPLVTNTAPSVQISSPAAASSFTSDTAITFGGSASDSQDGNITTNLAWTSSIDGSIGYGGSVVKSLTAGSHVITAKATDSGGLVAYKQVAITVAAPVVSSTTPTTTAPTLSANAYKVKGGQTVDLTWSDLPGTAATVYRNNSKIGTTANDGYFTDKIGKIGTGLFSYKLCADAVCTNTETVSFR